MFFPNSYVTKKSWWNKKKIAWLTMIIAATFFFFDFMQIGMINTFEKLLINKESGVEGQYHGFNSYTLLDWSFRMGNLLFILPAGWLLRRATIRKTFLSSLLLSLIGLGGFSLSVYYTAPFHMLLFFRFLSGAAHAFCFLCCAGLARNWFPVKQQGVVMSSIIMIGLSGLSFAQKPLAWINQHTGSLPATLGWMTLSAILLWGLSYWIIEDYPTKIYEATIVITPSVNAVKSWQKAIQHRLNWQYSFLIASLNTPITIFLIYSNQYLQIQAEKNSSEREWICFYFTLGIVVGGYVISQIEAYFARRRPLLIGGTLMANFLFLMIIFSPKVILPTYLWSFLFFLLGLSSGTQMLCYPALAECNPLYLRDLSMTLTSLVVMGSLAIWDLLEAFLLSSCPLYEGNVIISLAPLWLFLLAGIIPASLSKDKERVDDAPLSLRK